MEAWITGFKLKAPRQKASDKSHPDKNPQTVSPRYKSQKKIGVGIFFLGLVDRSRNRLASTAYFAIISSIILGGLLLEGFCPGALCRGLSTGYRITYSMCLPI